MSPHPRRHVGWSMFLAPLLLAGCASPSATSPNHGTMRALWPASPVKRGEGARADRPESAVADQKAPNDERSERIAKTKARKIEPSRLPKRLLEPSPIARAQYEESDEPILLPAPAGSASPYDADPAYVDEGAPIGSIEEGDEIDGPFATTAPIAIKQKGPPVRLPARKTAPPKARKSMANMLGIAQTRGDQHKHHNRRDMGANPCVPRELRMSSHPMYVVEPPDVLYIEATQAEPSLPPLAGERLVRQDGTISLGYYGQIHVAGLMLHEIEQKIRDRLSESFNDPQVYVDVAAFNSKVYYVVGQVQQQGRLPITGNETVLDALLLAGGPTNFAKIKKMHVARPNPGGGCDQILWVDFKAITQAGDTRTNYQLLPGDRVVVPSTGGFQTSVLFDNILPPFERLAGLGALLRFTFYSNNNNNN